MKESNEQRVILYDGQPKNEFKIFLKKDKIYLENNPIRLFRLWLVNYRNS